MNFKIKYKDSDLIGKTFNKLTIENIFYKNKLRYAHCRCECGKEKDILLYAVIQGKTKSCGCIRIYTKKVNKTKPHPLYSILWDMKKRCYNKNSKSYPNYGGRGIRICDEWNKDSKKFVEDCISLGWKKELTIDRINVNGNYEPNNIRFVSRHIQSVNQRIKKTNKSGYKGIFLRKNRWLAKITVNKKQIHIGYFDTKKEALDARNNYIIKNKLYEYEISPWNN